mmetsp:Transcript_18913/g.75424  ORF Transcript_18913/g.75424 Transcript_18913/m.75424 type:complete len:315 (-) Transcript_18913:204-1148(-)
MVAAGLSRAIGVVWWQHQRTSSSRLPGHTYDVSSLIAQIQHRITLLSLLLFTSLIVVLPVGVDPDDEVVFEGVEAREVAHTRLTREAPRRGVSEDDLLGTLGLRQRVGAAQDLDGARLALPVAAAALAEGGVVDLDAARDEPAAQVLAAKEDLAVLAGCGVVGVPDRRAHLESLDEPLHRQLDDGIGRDEDVDEVVVCLGLDVDGADLGDDVAGLQRRRRRGRAGDEARHDDDADALAVVGDFGELDAEPGVLDDRAFELVDLKIFVDRVEFEGLTLGRDAHTPLRAELVRRVEREAILVGRRRGHANARSSSG